MQLNVKFRLRGEFEVEKKLFVQRRFRDSLKMWFQHVIASCKVENSESREIYDLRTFKICTFFKFRKTPKKPRDSYLALE